MRKIILLVLAISCYGCASSGGHLEPPGQPGWYPKPPNADAEYLYASNLGESRNLGIATEKAKTQCRADLANSMTLKVDNLIKSFRAETGLDSGSETLGQFEEAIKTVAFATLHGVTVQEIKSLQLENGIYRIYVLMSMPIGEASAAMVEKITANERLHTRFRASQAYEELEAEKKAYEEAIQNR